MMVYVVALVSIVLGAVAQYCLKIGVGGTVVSNDVFEAGKRILFNWNFIAGVLCYALSFLLWLVVLSRLDLSKAYPMVSFGYVIAVLLGYFMLGEELNAMKIAGLLFIMAGVLFISRS